MSFVCHIVNKQRNSVDACCPTWLHTITSIRFDRTPASQSEMSIFCSRNPGLMHAELDNNYSLEVKDCKGLCWFSLWWENGIIIYSSLSFIKNVGSLSILSCSWDLCEELCSYFHSCYSCNICASCLSFNMFALFFPLFALTAQSPRRFSFIHTLLFFTNSAHLTNLKNMTRWSYVSGLVGFGPLELYCNC